MKIVEGEKKASSKLASGVESGQKNAAFKEVIMVYPKGQISSTNKNKNNKNENENETDKNNDGKAKCERKTKMAHNIKLQVNV